MKRLIVIAALITSSLSYGSEGFYPKITTGASFYEKHREHKMGEKLNNHVSWNNGFSLGYRFNTHLRLELGGYYNKPTLHARNRLQEKTAAGSDIDTAPVETLIRHRPYVYSAFVTSYIDLFKYLAMRPFIGAGVGYSYTKNRVQEIRYQDTIPNESFFLKTKGHSQLAYRLTTGISFDLTESLFAEVGYSFEDYGTTTKAYKTKYPDDATKTVIYNYGKIKLRTHNITTSLRLEL